MLKCFVTLPEKALEHPSAGVPSEVVKSFPLTRRAKQAIFYRLLRFTGGPLHSWVRTPVAPLETFLTEA